MARNMSFALTADQIRAGTKTVTRRLGWQFLKAGDVVNACVKCLGLKKGETLDVIRQIRVVSVNREPLYRMLSKDQSEAAAEGFPDMNNAEFVEMFCSAMRCLPSQPVTRIEFEYLT